MRPMSITKVALIAIVAVLLAKAVLSKVAPSLAAYV